MDLAPVVAVPEPVDGFLVEDDAGVLADRRLVRPDADARVDQHLVVERGGVPLGGHERGDRGEGSAGGVARDGEAPVPGDRVGVGPGPLDGGAGVLDGRGEGVLGGQPVVDREDATAALPGEVPAEPVVGGDAPQDVPAAVEEDDGRERAVRVREVEADVEFARGTGDRPVDGPSDLRDVPVPEPHRRAGEQPEELQAAPAVRKRDPLLACDCPPGLRVDLVGLHGVPLDDPGLSPHGSGDTVDRRRCPGRPGDGVGAGTGPPDRASGRFIPVDRLPTAMNRQQIIAILFVILMLGSSIAYGISVI